jgi:hypothetical protein
MHILYPTTTTEAYTEALRTDTVQESQDLLEKTAEMVSVCPGSFDHRVQQLICRCQIHSEQPIVGLLQGLPVLPGVSWSHSCMQVKAL